MEHAKIIRKYFSNTVPDWIKEKANDMINEALTRDRHNRSICCNAALHHFSTYGYYECSDCGEQYRIAET